MEELATSVLAYALWPLLTLSIVALWAAAALDILRHKRRGTFTNTGLLGMAAVVSVVAVIAVSGICAVFADQWFEAVSRAGSDGTRASGNCSGHEVLSLSRLRGRCGNSSSQRLFTSHIGSVAQLDRALASGARGRAFESRRAHSVN